jgi:CRISPR-associated protein Csd2
MIRKDHDMTAITQRHEFVYLFDVTNGNPNGDPDAGNLPRLDPETNKGLVTDVCLKRKIRNFVSLAKEGADGHAIYMQEKAILNEQHLLGRKAVGLASEGKEELRKLPKEAKKAEEITAWMCGNFFDIRTFGAVMTTGVNAGQVRGPVQIGFATSIDPVLPMEISITRMAVTTTEEAEKQSGDNRTMGRKNIIPYGLYRAHGFVSAKLAERTGFSSNDLDLLWQSLLNMFEHDRSAARGEMAARKLVVFEHESALGNAHAQKLFELVQVRRAGTEADGPARSYSDYEVSVDIANRPGGVAIHELL